MLASIRSTLPLKNFDVVERTVLGGNLDPKFIRAINTGVFYPEITSDADDASDGEDDMPALEKASVASVDENEWEEQGEPKLDDVLAPGKLEPRAFNRPVQNRPAPGLRRDPITEQHAEQIARKEAKVRAARRRQADDVRARAERPEELFQHEREERDRLRAEKGFVVDDEDEDNPKLYTCCLQQLQTSLQGMPKVNTNTLTCKYDEESYGIRANSHRLRMDCEKGCELRCHHPSCVRALTVCGLHSKEQPWGKMDAKNTSQQLSKDGVVMRCLKSGCGGRLIRTAIEKDRGVRRAEVWYHAKWHQDIIEEEERQKRIKEEEAARARAEADEQRKKDEKAAEVVAKKAAKQAAKAAKEAARRPDLVGLDGVQIPVPPKRPQKPKAEDNATKADVAKPDLQDVERWIEAKGASPARQSDDVFAAVPSAKKDKKKNKRRDRRKKVLDVEFGEQQDDAENAEVTRVEVAVERAVNRIQQMEPAESAAGAGPTLVEEFPDLAGGPAQASAEAVALAMLEAHNYEEADYTTPVTPFLLCKNLDVATLLQPGAPPMQRRFKNCLPRVEVRKVRVFEEQACAALEVSFYDGASACRALNGQLLGTKPIISMHLIEFPDTELMSAIAAARNSGEDADAVIRFIVAQRRAARAERNLPTYDELRTQRAVAATPSQPPVQLPPGKGAAPSVPVSMDPVARSLQQSGEAQATSSPAPTRQVAAPSAPDRTFEEAETWLRSAENPNARLHAIPQLWVCVTDLYVLSLKTTSMYDKHYKKRTSFLLSDEVFPQFKADVDEGRQMTAALVFFVKEAGKFYGVMRMEPRAGAGKVACKAFIEEQARLTEAASKPSISPTIAAEIQDAGREAKHYVSMPAWQILDAFSINYGLS